MNKRFFSLLAAFALCLTLIPTTAFADDEKRGEDVSSCSCETACTADNMRMPYRRTAVNTSLLRTEPAKTAAPREPMIRMVPQS